MKSANRKKKQTMKSTKKNKQTRESNRQLLTEKEGSVTSEDVLSEEQ